MDISLRRTIIITIRESTKHQCSEERLGRGMHFVMALRKQHLTRRAGKKKEKKKTLN